MSNRILPAVRVFANASNKNIQVNYSPTVALFGQDATDLVSNNAVRRLSTRNAVDKAHLRPDVLRWRVVTHTSAKLLPLSTQRNRLRRRWSSAIIASLGKHGLTHDGKLRRTDALTMMQGAQELGGTLEILIRQAYGWELTPAKMRVQSDRIIDSLLKSGLGTRRIKVTALEQLEQSVSQPAATSRLITPRPRDHSRSKPSKPFNPSTHKPSWYTASHKT